MQVRAASATNPGGEGVQSVGGGGAAVNSAAITPCVRADPPAAACSAPPGRRG